MKKKRFVSKETREKMRLAKLGKKRSKKDIEKIRQGTIKAMANPRIKRKMRLAKLGKPSNHKGYKCSAKQIKRMSDAHKGQIAWNKDLKGCYKQSKETIEKRVSKMRGKDNPAWKGGITPLNLKIRTSSKFEQWRKAVFKRDNFTCQKTKIKGGKLNAHHIENFSSNSKLRLKVSNGITLSEKSHKEFHKIYGIKNNNKYQIKKYLAVIKG